MHNLIYLSTSSYLFSDEELIEILSKSRANNSRLDITGLLLYNEGSILQILEGDEEKLHTLYNTISRDGRHKGVIKMIDCRVDHRSFQDWSMGFKQVSQDDWHKLSGYLNLDNKEEFRRIAGAGSSPVIAIIKSFTSVNRIT